MIVYVVTDGDYSDYAIQKIFSNEEAAEDYKYWHHIDNPIEEYEVADSWGDNSSTKHMYIRVMGKCYAEGVVNINYDIHPTMATDMTIKHANNIWSYNEYASEGAFTLYCYHLIPIEHWDEEHFKQKYTKSLYDLNAFIRSLLADGAGWDMVKKLLAKQEDSNES